MCKGRKWHARAHHLQKERKRYALRRGLRKPSQGAWHGVGLPSNKVNKQHIKTSPAPPALHTCRCHLFVPSPGCVPSLTHAYLRHHSGNRDTPDAPAHLQVMGRKERQGEGQARGRFQGQSAREVAGGSHDALHAPAHLQGMGGSGSGREDMAQCRLGAGNITEEQEQALAAIAAPEDGGEAGAAGNTWHSAG